MIIDLPDGSEVEVPDNAPPEVREQVKQKIRLKFGEPAESGWSKAGGYLAKRAGEIGGAAVRLGKDAIRFPATERPLTETGSDLLTAGGPALALTAGPVLGPTMVVGGLAAGAGAAAAGMSNPELAEAAVNVGGGVLGAGKAMLTGGAKVAGNVLEEGEKLRTAVPAVRQTIAKATAGKFDPIVGMLQKSGRTIRGNTPEGADLLQGLDDALEFAKGPEKRIINGIVERISKYGEITPAEMDAAMKDLSMTGKGWSAKSALNRSMSLLGKGTPVEGKLAEAQKEYHRVIVPAKQMAKAMAGKTPGQAAASAVRVWNSIAPESRTLLDPAGEIAPVVEKLTAIAPTMERGGFAAAHAMHRAGIHFLHGNVLGGMMALAGAAPKAAAKAVGRTVPGLTAGAAGAASPLLRGASSGASEPPPARSPAPEEAPAPAPRAAVPQPPQRTATGVKPLPGPYGREIAAVSHVVGIPPQLIQVIMKRENPQQNPTVVSADPSGPGKGGAVGMMQLLPGTFEQLRPRVEQLLGRKADMTNPLDNIAAGALYLKEGLDKTGSVEGAARYYHGGPNVAMHGPRTQAYGAAISRNYPGD